MSKLTTVAKIKKMLPLSVQKFLKSYYRNFLRFYYREQYESLGRRNWDMDIRIPVFDRYKFKKSILMGAVYPVKETNYTNIILCAQPKSASLYMVDLLSQSLEYCNHQIGFDNKGGSIYYPRLLAAKYIRGNTISHCHAEPSPVNLYMIKSLNFKPVILTRNLLDAIVSRRDMLIRDKWAENILSKDAVSKFINGSNEYQLDVVINLFADTYINFNAGWYQITKDTQINPFFMTYQEIIDDEVELVKRVANHFDVEVSSEHIYAVSLKIKKAGGINFSKGVVGRGKSLLTEEQISTLKRKASILGCRNEQFLGFQPD